MRGEFEFKLTTPKRGGRYPEQLPPLRLMPQNLRGSFRQTLRYLTNKGISRRGARMMRTNRGVIITTQGVRRDLQILVLQQRTRIGLLPRRYPWGGQFQEKQNTETTSILRGVDHPCIIRLEDVIDTKHTLHSEKRRGTPCAGTHGRRQHLLRVIVQ